MLTENGNGTPMYMPVAPAYGGGYGNGGLFGGDGAWWLLVLLLCGGGWGFGGFGGGMMPWMMGGMGGWGMDYLYPWLNNSQHISDGFRDQALQTSIGGLQNSVTAGFGDVQNSLCAGFAGVNASIANASTANMQQLFGVQSALQNCCCENRAGLADLKYTVATENCADRTAAYQNTRDIIDSQTRGTQAILDKLCALELDGVKGQLAAEQRENANLRSDLQYSRGQASQEAQSTDIVRRILNEMRSCPVPSQPVYGNAPIFTCGGNTGCGCSGNF
jgi:hypothetical protein